MNKPPLVIEKLVVGGEGLARRPDGLVVLVPGVIPGEKVLVDTVHRKKSLVHGQLTEVLEASPDRVSAPCPFFGRCGGCHFQHISMPRQNALKQDIFLDEFQRSGLRLDRGTCNYLASPQSFGYRQRIRLHAHQGRLGFFQHRSHDLLEIDRCLLARSEINTLLQGLIQAPPWSQVAEQVCEVEIHANPGDGSCVLIIHLDRKPRPRDLTALQDLMNLLPGLAALLVKGMANALYASFPEKVAPIHYMLTVNNKLPVEISLEPGGFCQVNEGQNQQMVNQVLAWLQDEPRGRVLDLFCGVGNFSLPLARKGFKVTGVDQQRAAIRAALRNMEKNGLPCEFRRGGAHEGLAHILRSGETFDYVLLDPPRAGFKEGCQLLPALHAAKIIYISCDQATLFRDLKSLCAQGYAIADITLVDQFCQSYHLEVMVLLVPVSLPAAVPLPRPASPQADLDCFFPD